MPKGKIVEIFVFLATVKPLLVILPRVGQSWAVLSNLVEKLKVRRAEKRRQQNLSKVEKFGFRAIRISAALQPPLYHLEDASGKIFDNGGKGYRSSDETRLAAEKLFQGGAGGATPSAG